MITVYNANNLAQQWFFQRAYLHLEAAGKLDEKFVNPNKTFLSLESYFANIGTLIRDLKATYALIPSDEEPFEINANTRAIKIPAAFAKGVAVVGDDMSEVITFTIDRYFDYVDLGGTDIYVQWILPGEDGGNGISKITLIDFETIPGKIRFGWPLTDKLTQYAGKVTFAVRFVVENKTNPNKYDYVFNTSPATINIMPGMNISVAEADFAEINIKDEFDRFVENSQNPYLPTAESPFWTDERNGGAGKDLEIDSPAAIDPEEDELVLKAQALVNGNGYIDYKWFFKQGGRESEFDAIEIVSGDVFTVNNVAYELVYDENGERTGYPKDGKRVGSEQYYTASGEGESLAYTLYLDTELRTEDGPFYERFTTLTINKRPENFDELEEAEQDKYRNVTGAYWVQASNYVGEDDLYIDPAQPELGTLPPINKSTGSSSSDCVVPTPKAVSVKAEPAKTVFIEGGSVELKATLSEDPGKPLRTYSWYKNTESSEMVMEEVNLVKREDVNFAADEAKEPALELTGETLIPGWYYFDVDSQLNRAIAETKSSHAYRVTNLPVKPTLTLEYCNWNTIWDESDPAVIEEFFNNPANWHEVDPEDGMMPNVAKRGEPVRLRVSAKLGDTNIADLYEDKVLVENLLTDGLTYKWYIIPLDATPDTNSEDEGIYLDATSVLNFSDESNNSEIKWGQALDTNQLDVLVSKDNTVTSYYCEVINTLKVDEDESKSATFGLEDYNRIFNIW